MFLLSVVAPSRHGAMEAFKKLPVWRPDSSRTVFPSIRRERIGLFHARYERDSICIVTIMRYTDLTNLAVQGHHIERRLSNHLCSFRFWQCFV